MHPISPHTYSVRHTPTHPHIRTHIRRMSYAHPHTLPHTHTPTDTPIHTHIRTPIHPPTHTHPYAHPHIRTHLLLQACCAMPYIIIAPIEMVVIYFVLTSYIEPSACIPGYLLMLVLIAVQTSVGKCFYRFRLIPIANQISAQAYSLYICVYISLHI